jgi:hypothetical protein
MVASTETQSLEIKVDETRRVSGILMVPPQSTACFVVAHGAGAGMLHSFMENLAVDLSKRGIATLRYQFPYMEKHGRRPDPPALCHASVRAAVSAAQARLPALPLLAGGKSFGGRMTSQAQADAPIPGVRGLVFLGFPLHPPKEPSDARGEHLSRVAVPMLFVQGARDAYAESRLLNPLIERLGLRATLCLLPEADHSFHVPARGALSAGQINEAMLDALVNWAGSITRGAA